MLDLYALYDEAVYINRFITGLSPYKRNLLHTYKRAGTAHE